MPLDILLLCLMSILIPAIRYAKAIFEIAIEENAIENVFNDMNVIDFLSNDSLDFWFNLE